MVSVPINVDIFALSEFTYSFEADTTILLTRVVQEDLTIIWNASCPSDVDLGNGIESATICQVTAHEVTTTGTVSCLANIYNDNNGDEDVIFRAYSGGVEIGTTTNTILSKETMQSTLHFEITAQIAALEVVSFTLEAQKDKMYVRGGESPSQIQIKRIT